MRFEDVYYEVQQRVPDGRPFCVTFEIMNYSTGKLSPSAAIWVGRKGPEEPGHGERFEAETLQQVYELFLDREEPEESERLRTDYQRNKTGMWGPKPDHECEYVENGQCMGCGEHWRDD